MRSGPQGPLLFSPERNVMLEQVMQVALSTPLTDPNSEKCVWGLPILLWGDPGIGKSARIKRMGNLVHAYSAIIFPSGRLPEDFAGTPVQDGKGGLVTVSTLQQVKELCTIGEGLMYLDEINTARPMTQAALLGVILDRRMGDLVFPGGVRIVAAANDPKTNAGANELSLPLANRFVHYSMSSPAASEWGDFMFGIDQPEDQGSLVVMEQAVRAEWPNSWAHALSQVVGYIRATPAALHKMPQDGEDIRAYATPRTWDWAARSLATSKALKVHEAVTYRLIQGCVGTGAADEFTEYMLKADLPSPEDVLKHGFTPDGRMDRSYAVYTALATYVVSMAQGAARRAAVIRTWEIFERAVEARVVDLLFPAVSLLVEAGLSSLADKEIAKAASRVVPRFDQKLQKKLRGAYGKP